MKVLMIALLQLFALAAHASTYQTSTGAVFTQVHDPDFGLAWQEPSQNGEAGKIWSSYQGDFDNNAIRPDDSGTVDERGGWLIVESQATRACAKIHGRLPLPADYDRLLSYFEYTNLLTPQGKKDLQAIFPDMQDRWFWTSMTTGPTGLNQAQGFFGFNGFIDYYGRGRDMLQSVRCIH